MATDVSLDQRNRTFWNELCGSRFAKDVGITDHCRESLQLFDAKYLEFYPYLLDCVRPGEMAGKRVLEVGLGYGTLGQRLAAAGACYHGLDIADRPVQMMNARLRMIGRDETAVQGNMLHCPFEPEFFDFVVSIGCFHHTGDLQRCIDETYRVLKPGGMAIVMVYNQFSLAQWRKWPLETLRVLARQWRLWPAGKPAGGGQRKTYDMNLAGEGAPETVFTSIARLRRIFSRFRTFQCSKQNCDSISFRGRILVPRQRLLPIVGRFLGLDLYVRARK
jgi:SAM-dependent methyltransferase